MYDKPIFKKSSIKQYNTVEGETIETKVERLMKGGGIIDDGKTPIFTERKEGVPPGFNIRTDRMDVAIEAMDKVSKSYTAKRMARMQVVKKEEDDGGAESADTTK